MKIKYAWIFIPLLLNAQNFKQITQDIVNSLKYKQAQKQILLFKQKLKTQKALNYGSLSAQYDYARLFNTPIMKMSVMEPIGVNPQTGALIYTPVNSQVPLADKDRFVGVLKYSYPLFSGFAISNSIKKAKLELIKQKLNLQNVKRLLILNSAKFYAEIYALKAKIYALNKAKEALLDAKQKAEALYKEGLINKAQIAEINAKYYETAALIKQTKSEKYSLLNMLSTLVNKKITDVDSITSKRCDFKPNFNNRPDVKMIVKTLLIAKSDIKIAESKYYPQIGFEVALKKEAQRWTLDKNDYENTDKSYAAISIRYDIFDGGKREGLLQSAKIAKQLETLFYRDYIKQIKTEYYNDLNKLKALYYRLKAAREEIKARSSYYELIKAKFNEGLADSSDLNDAIAKLATARAKKEAIKAEIFFLNVKLKLDGGESVK